jgi:SSS family solute:Na+ symporter
MESIQLAFSDWLIIAIYFGFVLGIGYYLKRFTKNENDFFLAGRKNSSWVAGLAFLSANLGALELLGMTGNTFKYGMYVAHFYWIGAIPAMLFLGLYNSARIKSVPGYLKLRFDEKTRVLNGIAFAVMTLLVSGINLYAMALVLHTFLGWDWNISMWISAATVAAYVTLSGLLSAIFTEIIQFFLIWFGLFLVSILGIIEIGSVNDIFRRVNELYSTVSYTTLWSSSADPSLNGMVITWGGIVLGLGFVLSFGYWTTDFLVVQRAFSAKDLRAARMTPILASFFKMAVPFIVILTGLIAIVLANDAKSGFSLLQDGGQVNYDSALPLLIARYYPPGLVGLGVTALLAGFMAGQAGNISAFNTVWTYDIYHSVLNRKASDTHLLWMGRMATIAGILISVGTAYWAKSFPSIMDYMQAIFSWVNAPLFATMLLGMFVRWITPNGAFWGLLAGMGSSFTMFLAVKFNWFDVRLLTLSDVTSDMAANFWRAWWAWVICFVVTIVISLFTERKPDSELVGLVKGLTPEVSSAEIPWYRKPEPYAIVSVLVLIALNIYFW